MNSNKGKAVIIGGGIMGLASAYYLLKSGWKVTLIDKGDLSDNCSQGNAGMLVPSHFIPLAAPGMISKGIKWMFNSRSPFYVKPSLDFSLISWGLKFMKSATQANVERAAPFLRDYHLLSKQLYEDLAKEEGFDFGLEEKGILMLYKTEKAGEEEIHVGKDGQKLGLDIEMLSKEQVQAIEPDIKLDVMGAVHYHCDAHLYPNKLMAGLVNQLTKAGVKIHRGTPVTKIEHTNGEITQVISNDKSFTADAYVMAGGAWTPAIAKLAGLNTPLMPGKGYSFMVDEPQHRMMIPALLCEARVSVTPMNGQIRFGGTMEIGKINQQVNMNRVAGIVESIPQYFPDFAPAIPRQKDIWFGFRPCSPDGLPYIGFSGKYRNLAIATGHGMMGLSLAPATGKLIDEVLNERTPSTSISQFAAERYA